MRQCLGERRKTRSRATVLRHLQRSCVEPDAGRIDKAAATEPGGNPTAGLLLWPRLRPRAANTGAYAGAMRVSRLLPTLALAAAFALLGVAVAEAEPPYTWRTGVAAPDAANTLSGRIAPPPGYSRQIFGRPS